MKYQAIVLAAGSSTRSNLGYNKVLYKLDSKKTIIETSLQNFIEDNECSLIFLVCKEDEIDTFKSIVKSYKVRYVIGGKLRQDSVYNALKLVTEENVLVHDGARPYFTNNLLKSLKEALIKHDAIIPVIDLKDTIKEIKDNKVIKTLDRKHVKIVQTPQAFKTGVLLKAYENSNVEVTDDSSLVENINEEVYTISGEVKNIKFTNKEDF